MVHKLKLDIEYENEGRKIDFKTIENNIRENDINSIAAELEKNSKVLLQNPSLIDMARTREMVETLLQLDKLSVFKFIPSVSRGLHEWDIKSRLYGLDIIEKDMNENYTIQRAIAATFPSIIRRWPDTALRIMDNYIRYTGLSDRDPQLSAQLDYSLMIDQHKDHRYWMAVARPEQLLCLSLLNEEKEANRQLLHHPLVVSFIHLEFRLRWKNILLKTILLFLGFVMLNFDLFYHYNQRYCAAITSGKVDSKNSVAYFICSVTFFLLLSLSIAADVLKLYVFRGYYASGIMFQAYVMASILTGTMHDLDQYNLFQVNMMLALLINFMKAATSSCLMGSFVLLTYKILMTMSKILLPIMILILALAGIIFLASYGELAKVFYQYEYAPSVSGNNDELNQRCFVSNPFFGELGKWEFVFFWKKFFTTFSHLFGEVNMNDLIVDNGDFNDINSVVNTGRGFQFIVVSVMTGVVLMNLLIGLAIGDVNASLDSTDYKIIQLQLREEYLKVVWKNIVLKLFRRNQSSFTPEYVRRMVYPNQFLEGCIIKKKSSYRVRFEKSFTNFYVLGCANVRSVLLNHFKTNHQNMSLSV